MFKLNFVKISSESMDFNMDTYFGNICGSTNNEQLNITEQNSRMNYLNA